MCNIILLAAQQLNDKVTAMQQHQDLQQQQQQESHQGQHHLSLPLPLPLPLPLTFNESSLNLWRSRNGFLMPTITQASTISPGNEFIIVIN